MAHAGALFEVEPESNRDIVRLRVTFDLTKRVDLSESGWDSLVAALTGDEIFWARYGA